MLLAIKTTNALGVLISIKVFLKAYNYIAVYNFSVCLNRYHFLFLHVVIGIYVL